MDPNTSTPSPTDTSPQAERPTVPEAPVSSQPSEPAPEKRSKNKLVKIIALVAVGLLALFAVLYFFVFNTTRGAVAVSDKFVAAIQKEDAAAAYALTSDSFKSATQ